MSFYCLLWLWRQFTEISVLRTWNIFCQNLGDFLLVSNDTTIVFQNNTLIVESLLFPGWNIWSYCVPKLLFITKTYLWRYFSSTNISITLGKKPLKLCLLIKAFYNQWDHHQSVCSAEKLGVLINQVTKGNSLVLHCASLLFLENSLLLDVFWPRPGVKAKHQTVQKSAIFPQPSNQKQLKWSNTAYVNKWSFTFKIELCVFWTLYEGDSNF